MLGKEHPETLWNIINLACDLEGRWRYKEAEALYRRVLEGRQKVLRKEHPEILRSVNNLASALRNQGKYSEAEALDRRAI